MNHHGSLVVNAAPLERHSTALQALWIGVFAALTAAGAQLEIPHSPVPYTLQTFFVLLAGVMLGARNGAISQGVYIAAGLIGLPVFAGWSAGPLRLFGASGGYLLSFPIAALTIGYLARRNRSYLSTLVSMAVGLLVIFSLGSLYLYSFYLHDLAAALTSGFLIFSWWDGVKLLAAASIAYRLRRTAGSAEVSSRRNDG